MGSSKRRARGPVMAAKKKAEGGGEEAGGLYKDTVNLPKTTFEMRANAVVREPQIQKLWEERRVVQTLLETNPGPPFTLHDGPPYANGDLHIGHALNKILKDFVNRYQMLQGRKVHFIPGWDCHGLPIELKVLQAMDSESRKALTPITLRQQAAKFALQTVDKQKASFQRYGVWGDWENPYLTLQPEYEAAQIGVFGKMVVNGHIYRGRKPVHWSPSSRTALAEAELEYPEQHTSRSVYVAFPITHLPPAFPPDLHPFLPHLALAVWTTTPWTMPANAAVAVNDKIKYAVVQMEAAEGEAGDQLEREFGKGARNPGAALGAGGAIRFLVVAEDLVPVLAAKLGVGLSVKGTFLGGCLEHARYKHPLFDRESPVVVGGEYITVESGTGLVHTAPGHGQEDYQTGLKYGLPLLSPVDDAGRFTDEAGPFAGKDVLGEGNVAVIAALDAVRCLLLEEAYVHKYPYDWRTKKPTIFRATEQWFASVEGFRAQALEAIGQVSWVPPQGEKRIVGMTVGRADWCISRQRSWGVPIPVFYHVDTGVPLMTAETIAWVQQVVREHGTDAWFTAPVEDLLPPAYREDALAGLYRKGLDTMDVWFDSGSSWAAVLDGREGLVGPAQLYLEGSDQHRGWFQSSLLTSVAANGRAPYERVLTHGFVLDEKGVKMSKSVGNVVDPRVIIEGGKNQKAEPPYGADVLRLWVSSVDYSGDVLIGPTILKQMGDTHRKLRGTLRFLLGNLHDFDPARNAVAYQDLPAVDRFMMARLARLMEEVKDSYENFQFYKFNQILQRFVIVDLSNFYFDICKDRLYIGAADSYTRRACQSVLSAHLLCLVRAMAPVLPHMAEDCWQSMPCKVEGAETVFEALWPHVPDQWASFPPEETRFWETLLCVRSEVNKVVEAARVGKLVGANMDAQVYLHTTDAEVAQKLRPMAGGSGEGVDRLRYVLLASQVTVLETREEAEALGAPYSGHGVLPSGEQLWVGVARADGVKCERCWNYSTEVGTSQDHPTLCERCYPVMLNVVPKATVVV